MMDLDTSQGRDRSRRGERSRFSDDNKERDRSVDRSRKTTNAVYVSNIPYECTWQQLKDEFRKKIGEVKFVELFVDENNKSKGCGIVEFDDRSSVDKALELLHRIEFKGRKLIVKEDFGKERDKYGNIISDRRDLSRDRGGNRRGGRNDSMSMSMSMSSRNLGMDESKLGPTWGLSPQFLDSLGINRPLVSKVFVANLDYKVEEKKLREVFKLAGKVIDVELYRDKEGKSRGCGVIEYDHPVESVQAISMFHDQQLFDRPMTVRMDAMDDGPVRLPDGLKNVGMGLGMNGQPLRNVNQYLQSNSTISPMSTGGPGILGAVPQLGSALSNVVNTPALATLASLQGLAGVQNQLLGGNMNDMGMNMNSSMMNQNQMSSYGNSMGNSNQISSLMGQGYGRGDNSNYSSDQGMSRDYSSTGRFDQGRNNFGKVDNDFSQSSNLFNNGSNNARPAMDQDNKFSDSVVVTNLAPTVSWKMLREKFSCCGEIRYVESKSKDMAVIQFSNHWEAEKAIQMMDRTRIDGRTIDVRYF